MCYYPYVQHFSKEEVSISCLFFQVEERERHLAQPLFGAQVDQGQWVVSGMQRSAHVRSR